MVWQALSTWLFGNRKPSRKHEPRKGSRPRRSHLSLECLEDRCNPSSISGTVFHDATGNGLSADDKTVTGSKVELYFDMDNNGKLDSGDGAAVAVTRTDANGNYNFTGLSAGTYFVRDVLPFGYVRTAPVLSSYYTVKLNSTSPDFTGQNFDSFQKPDTWAVKDVYFLVNGTRVNDLRGHVHQGDTVTAKFTVRDGQTAQVTLVSYTAPGPSFNANTASQQQIFATDTNTFGPGQHSLTVQVPQSFFQVDFVLGAAIDHFGPAGSNIFYTPQDRLKSADNGGTTPPGQPTATLTGYAFVDNNNDGIFEQGIDSGIGNVTFTLNTTDGQGNTVSQTAVSESTSGSSPGLFTFTNLAPGTYTLVETRPSIHNATDLAPTAGTVLVNGQPTTDGTVDFVNFPNQVSSILLAGGQNGINFNFGESIQPAV